ncbi:MAG: radical SAM family heme chaperone HemW, partial [Verrucomicrobia bacterium]|nr:radical SAM family heme chaperone HemW [Verrucomicrobiota bacterium]
MRSARKHARMMVDGVWLMVHEAGSNGVYSSGPMAGAKTCSGSFGRSVSAEPDKISLIHRAETFAGQVVVPSHAIRTNHQPFTIPVEDGDAYGGNHSRSARLCADRGTTGLYVHVPFCDGKCAYCAFYSVGYKPALADRYLNSLECELAASLPLAPETIYIGGGTPSVLSARQIDRLCRLLQTQVDTCRLVEWSVEINPGSVDAEKAAVLAAAGVNRVSLGAQSFDDRILKTLGRRHSAADTVKAVTILRAAGIANIGLDLIACVPGCARALWRKTLRQAVALAPKHVSVYALTNEEGTRLNRLLGQGSAALLSDEAQLAMLDLAETELIQAESGQAESGQAGLGLAGFERYEISNYARSGFKCRHNVACWRGEQYVGLGPAAASHVGLKRWT